MPLCTFPISPLYHCHGMVHFTSTNLKTLQWYRLLVHMNLGSHLIFPIYRHTYICRCHMLALQTFFFLSKSLGLLLSYSCHSRSGWMTKHAYCTHTTTLPIEIGRHQELELAINLIYVHRLDRPSVMPRQMEKSIESYVLHIRPPVVYVMGYI